METSVRVWEEDVEIPTYGVGKPDRNPMFLEKRVYQGSTGKVYPYPVIDKILDEKRLQSYHLVLLENEYLHIEICLSSVGASIARLIRLMATILFITIVSSSRRWSGLPVPGFLAGSSSTGRSIIVPIRSGRLSMRCGKMLMAARRCG